jgi:hypothetical protein
MPVLNVPLAGGSYCGRHRKLPGLTRESLMLEGVE